MVSDGFDADSLPGDDPRLSGEYVRTVDCDGTQVVLVGVVHDHPASVFRARTVVEHAAPDVLALEIPAALVGLFEEYAAEDAFEGGEMTAAIRAAPDADAVGVDAPDWRSARVLAAELRDSDASVRDVATTVKEFGRLAAATVRGRLSAAGVPASRLGDVPGISQEFDCDPAEPADAQAAHESSHVRRSASLLRSFEVPAATRLLDAARERYMVRRLRSLGDASTVVAVVGFSHLDAVASGLAD